MKETEADSEGFELSVPFGTAVFKTAAIDHSANCPNCFVIPPEGLEPPTA